MHRHVARMRGMAQLPLQPQGLIIIEASRSHSDTPQSVELLWASDQPGAETYTQKDIDATGGIQTCNGSKRAAADPRL